MHTILGAGGPVANALTRELMEHNETVRLVSRHEPAIKGENVSWQKADLLNYDEVLAAAQGSTVIYLCAGLVYNTKIWQHEWPLVIQHVIDVVKATGARLIFFDNVYMYGLVKGPMTEETGVHPVSVKGQVRAKVAGRIMKEVRAGHIRASILRAADFYGSESLNSFYDMMVLAKYARKQKAMWLGNPKTKHAFTYVPDAARAMFLLGQHPECDNQIWHAPTAPALTGQQFIELASNAFQVEPKYGRVNKFMLRMVGMFNKLMREMVEMFYQYDHDYVFASTKFESYFNIQPTPYEVGVKHLSQTLFKE
jgi:nucleoside-diphosphate-sugar epimerase